MKNSRIYSVIFYVISLIGFVSVLYWLNKFERYKVPLERIQSISKYIVEDYHNRGKGIYDSKKNEAWYSNFTILVHIVSACGSGDSDLFGEKLNNFAKEQIKNEDVKKREIQNKKEKDKWLELLNIKDLFTVKVHVIDRKTVESKISENNKDVCNKLFAKNKPNEYLDNSYYVFVNENGNDEEKPLTFNISTSNVIEIHFNKAKKDADYAIYVRECWSLITNVFWGEIKHRQLEFSPELDLNFYLASSLYSEKNYKMQVPYNDSIVEEIGDNDNEIENNEKEYEIRNVSLNRKNIPVAIATWDFYDDFYYPYMRRFVERLLHVFQININSEIIGNLNLFKITEPAKKYLNEEEIKKFNLKDNARLLILDKVTKFTNVFDGVSFGPMLNKPTYKVPQNINLVSIFPNEEDIYFYNNLTGVIETTASFVEWGIIHINNLFTSIKKSSQHNKNIINVSNDTAHIINGLYISHLRKFLGLPSTFDKFVYTVYDSEKYKIKFKNALSKDTENYMFFNITNDSNFSFSFVQTIPLQDGITDYELLKLIREAYSARIIQIFENLNKFINISNISIYIRVPKYTVDVINYILNNVECSLSYMNGEECVHEEIKNEATKKFQNILKKEQYRKAVYFKIALILVQAAYQDSLQLLNDDRISIYEILSKDFLLASLVPTGLPFIFPVITSLFKEICKYVKKRKIKME